MSEARKYQKLSPIRSDEEAEEAILHDDLSTADLSDWVSWAVFARRHGIDGVGLEVSPALSRRVTEAAAKAGVTPESFVEAAVEKALAASD
jgi:hypothetical protein